MYDGLTVVLIIAGVALGLYWLGLWLRSDSFWEWAFDLEPSSKASPYEYKDPEPPPPPAPPLPRRDFGPHHNPLSIGQDMCQSPLEQHGTRAWQCPVCHLVKFEKPEGKP